MEQFILIYVILMVKLFICTDTNMHQFAYQIIVTKKDIFLKEIHKKLQSSLIFKRVNYQIIITLSLQKDEDKKIITKP